MNYRPIALLNSLDKLVVKVIFKQLVTQCREHNILRPEQFVFINYHSTTKQLLRLVELMTRGLNLHGQQH